MIRSTLTRREEDDDSDIADGEWQQLEVGGSGSDGGWQQLVVGVGGSGLEGDQHTSQHTPSGLGVEFLPGCDVLEWGNVEAVANGWVSLSLP